MHATAELTAVTFLLVLYGGLCLAFPERVGALTPRRLLGLAQPSAGAVQFAGVTVLALAFLINLLVGSGE